MSQNYLAPNYLQQLPQTPSMPSSYAYTLDEGAGSVVSSQTMPPLDEDDDYICLTCETECTCPNRLRAPAQVTSPPSGPSSLTTYASSLVVAPPNPGDPGAAPPASNHPSLKIKLTVRPHTHSHHLKPATAHQKKKKLPEARLAGENLASLDPSSSTSGHALTAGHSASLNAGGSVAKKRGRPSKSLIAARDIFKGSNSLEARHPGADIDRSIDGGAISRQNSKQVTCRKSGPQKPVTTKKGKKLHGAAAASKARAELRRAQQQVCKDKRGKKQASILDYELSELSELDDDEGDEINSLGLPTFISAFSSSSNSSSSESESDSETESAERFPHTLNNPPKEHPGYDHAQHRVNREPQPRKKKASAENDTETAGADSDAEDDADEEDEDDEDADADANDENADPSGRRLMRYAGIATGWTDDEEEDSFDADLFFANLSDSSADGTDDESLGDEETSDEAPHRDSQLMGTFGSSEMDVMRLSEFAAAGFLAPFAELERAGTETLGFGHGWDQPLLSNNLRDMLDVGMANGDRGSALGPAFEFGIPDLDDGDAMMATSEEEEAVAIFDNDDIQDPEDIVEIFEDSDGGETTEDEFVEMDGIATPRNLVLLRFPASLGAIDPMSTVSSPARATDRGRSMQSATSVKERKKKALKPHEILAGNGRRNSDDKQRPSLRVTIAPAMGSFDTQVASKAKSVVLTGSGSTASGKIVPSPYPAIRRLRKRTESLSMSGGQSTTTSRQSSLIGANRTPFEQLLLSSIEAKDETMPSAEPIKLDDVLDTAFFESQASDDPPESTQTEHGESDADRGKLLQNLQRWEHVPIDAFRRALDTTTSTDLAMLEMDKMPVLPPTPSAPRPSDGFSYGSSVGGMMRASPLNASLWNVDSSPTALRSSNRKGRGKLNRLASMVSPVLLPIRDGDPMTADERRYQNHQHFQQQAYLGLSGQQAAQHAQNIKSRKELRKEKKRNRRFFGNFPATSRNHFPNAKNRSMSGVQRSSSGSIPSLSI